MTAYKIIGSFLVSCVVHGGVIVAAFAFSDMSPAIPREEVYQVSLVHVVTPVKADVPEIFPVSRPEPSPPAPDPVAATGQNKPVEKQRPPLPKKPVSLKKKKVSPKPLTEETPVHQARPESRAASAGTASLDAGPSLRMGGFAAYGEDAVDQPPSLRIQVTPEYPQRARRMSVEGRVEVRLVVDSAGKPQACTVHKAAPVGYFEEAALAAARRTRFSPGILGGRPVNTLAHISFVFALR